jgi:molybdate transport system regulatory protein
VARIRLHIHLSPGHSLGPGKVQLLEAVREHGSISAAARSMGMAYRHAWELVDDLNRGFGRPVLAAAPGGRRGGGARLTPFGEEVVSRFRDMEASAGQAVARHLRALERRTRGPRTSRRPRRPRL